MNVKAVFAVFSDGEDTSSRNSLSEARRFIENLNSLEIPTVFIAFGNKAIIEATNLKFKSILKIDSNTPDPASALRHAFDVLSKSTIKSVSVVGNKGSGDLFTM
jgi:uracil DNA glycosylase